MENKKKILIIDDSNTALLLMEYALKESGYETQVASTVKEALRLIGINIPDLIMLDLSMPEISGFDFLEMKSELHIEKIPIIIVSAYDSLESIEKTRSLGAVDFIAKPIKLDAMMEKIRQFLKE
jgi:DNA-binding NtrC family response regulator